MKKILIEISDDPKYCYDSTKRLCKWVLFGINKWYCGLIWDTTECRNIELFEDNTQKLIKCRKCIEDKINAST